MPHRNRVDPFSRLIETPARGAWYGNRGCLHDRAGRITNRNPPTDAWIICLLEFKGRRRKPLLQPGRFTELFFLDEATGFAAGHRPCGECRRPELRRFGAAWPHKAARDPFAMVPAIDAVMRVERRDRADPRRRVTLDPRGPPADGLMFALESDPNAAVLAAGGRLWRWSPSGYSGPLPWAEPKAAVMLTPPSSAKAVENGYKLQIHSSALG